ncbi:MAG: hypothetical protein AB8G11_19965 [Saprospiraceae bacterium]
MAFSGSVEIYKHKNDGSYEEYLERWRKHDEELKQRREKEAEEARKKVKKWWQFWK